MLQPEQVLPYLIHSNAEIRSHAAEYFRHMGDAAPAETADQLWRAIDLFGHTLERGYPQRNSFFSALKAVPPTDASIERAIERIRMPDLDDASRVWLSQILADAPMDQVDRRYDTIVALLDSKSRAYLENRLALRSLAGDDLWQQFLDYADQAEKQDDSRGVPRDQFTRIIEALSRHREIAIPNAMKILDQPIDNYWLQTWCCELLGELRHAPAIDQLIEKMKDDSGDFLQQSAMEALARMDPTEVVSKLEASYINDDEFYRQRVADALGKNKSPLAEDAVMRLLEHETDHLASTSLCMALYDLVATKGLDQIRQVVIDGRYDSTLADIREELLILAEMVGYEFPELVEWKKLVASPEYHTQLRSKFLAGMGMDEEKADLLRKLITSLAEKGFVEQEPARVERHAPKEEVTLPIRRTSPKIGRNDPCPCGSGKKYKKCCGA